METRPMPIAHMPTPPIKLLRRAPRVTKNQSIRQEITDALLAAFRQTPGNIANAARIAGCTRVTATKAWHKGWPHIPYCARPMKDIIEEEQTYARAERERQAQRIAELEAVNVALQRTREREDALKDVTAMREREGTMVKTAMGASLDLFLAIESISVGITALGDKIREAVEMAAERKEALTLDEAREYLKMLKELTMAHKQNTEASQKAIEMERLLMGKPTAITASVTVNVDAMTMEEAQARINAANRAMERARVRALEAPQQKPMDGQVIDAGELPKL